MRPWCVVTLISIPCSRFQGYEAVRDQPWVLFDLLLLWWGICHFLPFLVCVVRVVWRRTLPRLSGYCLQSHWLWGGEKVMGCFYQCRISPFQVNGCVLVARERLRPFVPGWMLGNASPAGTKQEQEELQDALCCGWAESSPGLAGRVSQTCTSPQEEPPAFRKALLN